MKPYPTVAILVLNWNGRSLLERGLPGLMELDYPAYELVVIDNGSTDGSVPFLVETYPQVTLIAFAENKGFVPAYNEAMRQISADVMVLLNNDVEVRPDWLRNLVKPFVEDAEIGITGSKLLFPDGKTLQHAGAMIEYPLAIGRHRFYREVDSGQADELCDVDYVTGASLAVRQPVLEQIGLLDPEFAPFYYEEVDLCWRTRAAGFRVVYVPDSVAIHHESIAMRQLPKRMIYNLQRNRLLFVLKYDDDSQFLNEFVPAERLYLETLQEKQQHYLMRRAYLEMALLLPTVLGQAGETRQLDKIQEALLDLARTAVSPETSSSHFSQQPLTAFDFPTRAGKLRQMWHGVAGEWDMAHLRQQQTEVNQQVAAWLEKQAQEEAEISEDTLFLVGEIAARQLWFNQIFSALSTEMKEVHTRLDRLEARLAEDHD